MAAKQAWRDLPQWARRVIVGVGSVELALLVAAQVDLVRRPAEQVRGPKWCWRLFSFVNLIGPLAYFLRGRQRTATPEPITPATSAD